jgi:hypothetical protein
MVLAELGIHITKAISSLGAQSVIDEKVLDTCLKEISTALLQADVNVKTVLALRNGIKKRVNIEQLAAGLNKQRVIEKAGGGDARVHAWPGACMHGAPHACGWEAGALTRAPCHHHHTWPRPSGCV